MIQYKKVCPVFGKKGYENVRNGDRSSEEDNYVDQVWRRRDVVWGERVSGEERHE